MKASLSIALAMVSLAALIAAESRQAKPADTPVQSPQARAEQPQATPQPPIEVSSKDVAMEPRTAAPAAFDLNWYSINGGGASSASGGSYTLGLSVGQSVAGAASGGSYDLGIGFWYGAAVGGGCLVIQTGDVNSSGTLTSADIIYLVNFVFKSGADPLPCEAAGDVNCSGTITSADIIYLVNYVFKSGAAPCDVCTIVPGLWSCP